MLPYLILRNRLAKHSCVPNARVKEWEVAGVPCLVVVANRALNENEEVTLDLGYQLEVPMLCFINLDFFNPGARCDQEVRLWFCWLPPPAWLNSYHSSQQLVLQLPSRPPCWCCPPPPIPWPSFMCRLQTEDARPGLGEVRQGDGVHVLWQRRPGSSLPLLDLPSLLLQVLPRQVSRQTQALHQLALPSLLLAAFAEHQAFIDQQLLGEPRGKTSG